MWDNLSAPWQVAVEEAWAAYCAGSLPIGAAVIDEGGQVAARGRNRIYEREGSPGAVWDHRLAHAEVNALLALPRPVDPTGYALYTTMEPCPLCCGAVRMSRVRRVHFAARDPWAGSAALFEATPYMRRAQIQVSGPGDPALEMLLVTLFVDAACRTFGLSADQVVGSWAPILPGAVALGKALAASGRLRRLGDLGLPTAVAIHQLSRWLEGSEDV